MKKTTRYIFILALALLACACENEKEVIVGTLKGIFYADIPGEKAVVTIAPGASKSYNLRVNAYRDNVADAVMNFTFKADPDWVDKFNAEKGTHYAMCPGSAYEFTVNEVMLPRYGQASTTARVKVTASGLDQHVTYILPVTIDKATGSPNWEVADTLAAYVLLQVSDYDPNGPGTENNPYMISTVDDLKGMGAKMEEGTLTYFRLANDIDMTGVSDWKPCNAAEPYKRFRTLLIERSRASTDSHRRNWTRARFRFCSGCVVLK